ncbi:hypothetical protein C8Q75DRAFT_866195 [Abortiporus biennis]|nr:hypothetical protein C8Q75DRAFT_866195 [Abortiporus biennis]
MSVPPQNNCAEVLDNMGQKQNPLPTPPASSHSSPSPSEFCEDLGGPTTIQSNSQKKKKKKKSKKAAKEKEASHAAKPAHGSDDDRPPVLCISRNKHWRYISSYHGPWLQLPLELLESLLVLNLDPSTLSSNDSCRHMLPPPMFSASSPQTPRSRGFASVSDHSSPDSPRNTFANLPPPPPLPSPKPGKANPPPIDPGVFRSVSQIRKLIDEASELSVRASSGLSAVALGSLRNGGSMFNQNPWGSSQFGINGFNDGSGGRNVPMSATRVHRLRTLAVQKLAAAYKLDEIASSVMVMQGGSVFDDIAEKVLKVDPNDVDARYVHFFHEKIPSRFTSQLAESTTTKVLDELIAAQPQRLEFYRTRGIVHCFRDEYAQATKDFTLVLREARVLRKAKRMHHSNSFSNEQRGKASKKKKGKAGGSKVNGRAPANGTSSPLDSPSVDGLDGETLLIHPSVLPDAPEPIEPQCLFLRGAAYLQHAVYLIEDAILKLEAIRKPPQAEGAELRLCYIENGRYGGVEIGNPDGPLGSRDGVKLKAYREVLADDSFRDQIYSLLKKSMRDHEKFLSHFDTLEDENVADGNIADNVELAYHICENLRPNGQHPPPPVHDVPVMFTTYHPLLVESHFSILISQLMLGDFINLNPAFYRTALLVDGLEGYPVFLPPRSMAQAEFIEVLERLAGGWKNGIQPHSLSRVNSKSGLTIDTYRSTKAKEVFRTSSPPTPTSVSSEASIPSPMFASSSTSTSSLTSLSTLVGDSGMGINGSSSSSSMVHIYAPLAVSTIPSGSGSGRETPVSSIDGDLVQALDCARILLNPVAARQRERLALQKSSSLKKSSASNGGKKKHLSINIPLHGPRVEILMAWIGAVHLVELDSVA